MANSFDFFQLWKRPWPWACAATPLRLPVGSTWGRCPSKTMVYSNPRKKMGKECPAMRQHSTLLFWGLMVRHHSLYLGISIVTKICALLLLARCSPSGLGPADGLQQIQALTKFKHQVEIVLANCDLHQSWVVHPFYLQLCSARILGLSERLRSKLPQNNRTQTRHPRLVHESYVQLQSSFSKRLPNHHYFAINFILSIIQ